MIEIRDARGRVLKRYVAHFPGADEAYEPTLRPGRATYEAQKRAAEERRSQDEKDVRKARRRDERSPPPRQRPAEGAFFYENKGAVVAGSAGLGLVFLGLGLFALLGSKGRRSAPAAPPRPQPSPTPTVVPDKRREYLAARRADLTQGDLEALYRMVVTENPDASDAVHVEQVWTVINRAHKNGVSVRRLLMPDNKPVHQVGAPFSTWKPATPGPKGHPLPSPPNAAQVAERLVNQDPLLEGAYEFFDPAAQDSAISRARALRKRFNVPDTLRKQVTKEREAKVQELTKGATDLKENDPHLMANYWATKEEFQQKRAGKSLGQVGPVEFFRG